MEKRILTILLALVMILSLSTVAFADDGIDTADELKDAIANGNSEIVVTGDITLTEVITISGNVTIKANSAVTITSSAEDALTVTGTLTLGENITIDATESILYANGGTINVEGAALKSTHQTHALGFAANGGVINMKSGSINSYWTGLTASGTGAVNISGGSVESTNSNAVLAKGGATATVSGGAVKTGEFVTLWAKDSGKLVVTGGTITTGNNAISLESNATANVTGGTFNVDVSEYLANGFEMKDNGDGTYGVQEKVYPETVSFWGENLELGNTLNMAFIFAKDQRADWTGYTAKVTMNGETTTYSLDQWKTDNTGDYFYI